MCARHLALDLGSSSGKMLLGEVTNDRKIRLQEVGGFKTPRVWFNEHICIDIFRAFEETANILSKLGSEGVHIDSFAADSWSSDFGIVNPQGEPIGLPVFYRDWRTYGMPEEVERVIPYGELYRLSTQRRMQDSTLCQLLALKKEKPELLQGGNRIMFLADMLMYFFSHRVCSEITLASYSQLFSMEKKCWEDRVFKLFDIPTSIQPEVVNPCECLGRVTEKAAAWYGLNRFEIVAAAGHDTSSAVAAIPAEEGKNWAFISTGSWFLVGMELEKPMNLDMCYRYNFSNTGLAFGKTMLKRNVTAMWILQECMRSWQKRGINYTYPEIHALAEKCRPFMAMLDVDAIDFYNPDDMPVAICEYLKRSGQLELQPDDVGAITRIVDEAIAFKCAYAINCLEKITQRRLDTIYAVGGASAATVLNAMIADATNREIITGPREATSIGNCLLQAVGCGEIASAQELRQIVRNSTELKRYAPVNPKPWMEIYEAYRQFCRLEA